MSFGLIFWVLVLIWFVFALAISFAAPMFGHYGTGISTVMLFVLFLLLGWKVFGPPVHP